MASFGFLVLLLVSLMVTAHGYICIDCEKYKPRFGVKCCDPLEKTPVENLPVYKPSIEKPPVYKPSAEKPQAYKPLVDNPPAYKISFEPPSYKLSIKKPQV